MKFDKSIDFKEWQLLNMDSIEITFDVSKLNKFRDFKLIHPLNIELISSTFDVCIFFNCISSNLEHPSNIKSILVQLISIFEKSIDIILVHP